MADGKVVISTALDNGGLEKGLKGITGKLGGLKSVVSGVAASITAAFSAAAVAVGAVTKQAVDAYADYEQLAGGVETLFKDAASKVMDYAEDAFYTVGLSANEYMETVTSFSASLISSLGGDTAKAADIANMALVDIADNAAKLGSSLESIKTAYQGFAKGQYQLLDNLKIGYGGSKTEMERLLKDAQAITGVKYDINNLADVYNAIHAIQEKLGIAGTTAREAEKTISGSANMTKAAWKNVLAAISGGGDLDKAINNLVYSLTKYFDNIVPVVQRALLGVGELVEKIGPMLVQNVASALIQALPSLMNAVHQMLIGLAKGIYQGIAALFSSEAAEISAQLSETDTSGLGDLVSGFDAATESAEGTAKAAKKVEKSLAGFDEIQKLGGKDKDDGTDAVPSIGGTSIPTVAVAVTPELNKGSNPLFKAAVDKIRGFMEPLNNIDFSAAKESLSRLGGAFRSLADSIGSVFGWAWFNILTPLAEWAVEEAAPASLDALSSAIEATSTTIDVLSKSFDPLWQKLKPVFAWIGDTAITILNDFKEIGKDIAQIWEDNSGKLEETFENIGLAVEAIWTVIEPIFAYIRASLSTLATELPGNELQHIIDQTHSLSEVLTGIITLDPRKVLSGFGDAIEGELTYAGSQTKTFVESLGIDLDTVDQWISDTATKIGDWFSDAWGKVTETWDGVAQWFQDNVITPVEEFFAPVVDWFDELFGSVYDTASDVFYDIGVVAEGCWAIVEEAWKVASDWFEENVTEPIGKYFSDVWENAAAWASDAWEGIKEVFSNVASFFEETFEKAWKKVTEVFAPAGEIFVDIKDGIAESFKEIVNGLIRGLNSIFSNAFDGINAAIGKIRDFRIFEMTPFANMRTISVPQIPYLAQGAVLPPNRPFLAMVGDQRHGTNVEAPLETIQEAVALVMEDLIRSNIAGHEATVAVLKEILEAVLGIEIGDDVIGNAVARYNSKMAIIRGGA